MAPNDAVRASSRPKNSSTKRRATWVDSTRSVGAWKEPTFSARLCRSATELALGANGSCTCTKSSGASVSTSSIVRAMSTGGDGAVPRRRWSGSSSPTPSTRTPPSGSNSASGRSRAARISFRDSRTSCGERDGASTSSRCPRSASSFASSPANALTSCSSSHGWGVTWAIANRSGTARSLVGGWWHAELAADRACGAERDLAVARDVERSPRGPARHEMSKLAPPISLSIVYEPVESGWVQARIEGIPEVITAGRTKAEARELVLDALREYLASIENATPPTASASIC